MKLPSSLIQDALNKLSTIFQRYHRIIGNLDP
jgi:hypothetical protein